MSWSAPLSFTLLIDLFYSDLAWELHVSRTYIELEYPFLHYIAVFIV